ADARTWVATCCRTRRCALSCKSSAPWPKYFRAVRPRGAEAQHSNRGYTLLGFAAVWLLLVVCLRKRIQLAIAVNEVSAKFVVHHPQMICVPLCQFLLVVAWLAVWVICTALIV
ncbi:slc44a2, partial [Symbiodinium necroappetens]